jgi:hypothetical protein
LRRDLTREGLNQHFMIVGTHALYAYESAMRRRATLKAPKDALQACIVEGLIQDYALGEPIF